MNPCPRQTITSSPRLCSGPEKCRTRGPEGVDPWARTHQGTRTGSPSPPDIDRFDPFAYKKRTNRAHRSPRNLSDRFRPDFGARKGHHHHQDYDRSDRHRSVARRQGRRRGGKGRKHRIHGRSSMRGNGERRSKSCTWSSAVTRESDDTTKGESDVRGVVLFPRSRSTSTSMEKRLQRLEKRNEEQGYRVAIFAMAIYCYSRPEAKEKHKIGKDMVPKDTRVAVKRAHSQWTHILFPGARGEAYVLSGALGILRCPNCKYVQTTLCVGYCCRKCAHGEREHDWKCIKSREYTVNPR